MTGGASDRLAAIKGHVTARSASEPSDNTTPASATPPPVPAKKDVPQAKASFYKYYLPFQTKWHENDMYDHLNNAVYITYFDAIINEYLVRCCNMVPSSSEAPIGLVVGSSFSYSAALEFPSPLIAALAVTRLGKSSVRYAIALFPAETTWRAPNLSTNNFSYSFRLLSQTAAAYGEMTHVFVDPKTRRPVDMDPKMRTELEKIVVT